MTQRTQIHATCVAIGGRGVLLRGPPGAGKSELAARLIVEAAAQLVADDRTDLAPEGGHLIACAPAAIAGRIELRGVGIAMLPRAQQATVALLVDLTSAPQRLPEPAAEMLLGVRLPRAELDPGSPAAPAKLRLALGAGGATILPLDD